jgi:hypothetical protein
LNHHPCSPFDENADSSIHCNFNPVSNVSDLSEGQFEKQDSEVNGGRQNIHDDLRP